MKHILIVEDFPMWREKFIEAATGSNREILAPTNSQELELALASGRYDIILLDGTLWDGEPWYRYQEAIVKALAPGGRIICVSSSESEADRMTEIFDQPVIGCSKMNFAARSYASLLD